MRIRIRAGIRDWRNPPRNSQNSLPLSFPKDPGEILALFTSLYLLTDYLAFVPRYISILLIVWLPGGLGQGLGGGRAWSWQKRRVWRLHIRVRYWKSLIYNPTALSHCLNLCPSPLRRLQSPLES